MKYVSILMLLLLSFSFVLASDTYKASDLEKMPEPVAGAEQTRQQVVYPEKARLEGVQGVVIVNFVVDENGDVKDAKAVREEPEGYGFAESAVKAVASVKYHPGMIDNKPVKVELKQTIKFKLD